MILNLPMIKFHVKYLSNWSNVWLIGRKMYNGSQENPMLLSARESSCSISLPGLWIVCMDSRFLRGNTSRTSSCMKRLKLCFSVDKSLNLLPRLMQMKSLQIDIITTVNATCRMYRLAQAVLEKIPFCTPRMIADKGLQVPQSIVIIRWFPFPRI